MACMRTCACGLALGAEEESHAAAAHAAEHPEAPEVVAEFLADTVDQRVGVEIAGPRNNGLDGAVEVALQAAAERADVAPLEMAGDLIEDPDGLAAAEPLGFTAQEVLLGDHLKNGTDILRHAAVDEHQALLKFLAGFARDFGVGEDPVIAEAGIRG